MTLTENTPAGSAAAPAGTISAETARRFTLILLTEFTPDQLRRDNPESQSPELDAALAAAVGELLAEGFDAAAFAEFAATASYSELTAVIEHLVTGEG